MNHTRSLIRRIWLASALLLPCTMLFSAFMLNRAYVNSLNSAEHEALFAQVYGLLALAEPDNTGLSLPRYLANPRFETPDSGLYARILDHQNRTIWASNSLLLTDIELPKITAPQPGESLDRQFGLGRQNFRSLSFATIWEIHGDDNFFNIEIIHNQRPKEREISAYRRNLGLWLGGLAVLLIMTQVVVTKWGLRPLRKLATDIGDIEHGKLSQLEGDYPLEITPVTESLNKLIQSENAQQNRYKNSLADLAHSLKTPLAVIRSQLGNERADKTIDEQVDQMSKIIGHQLKRASAEVRAIYGHETNLYSIVSRLCKALDKIYSGKNVDLKIEIDTSIGCAVQENDLMEVLGNLIENAFKYTDDKMFISAQQVSPELVRVNIEDNGPGVPKHLINQVLERGARADTAKSGQGLGLAVAVDILSSYNSGLKIRRSERLGGANITIDFAAK